jgi:hypothetical protein
MGVDPRDHEIPARIAGFLYSIGLIDAGDDFRKRVVAIAPTSDVAYRIELLRALNIGDESASIASARRAIEDDIDNRQFAYGGAVRQLMRVAAQQGRVAEESAYLEQQAPGILDIDAASVPEKFRVAQRVSFDAWYVSLEHEELMRRLDKTIERARRYGFDPLTDARTRVAILVLRGETEQAIDIALANVFTEPVTKNMSWQEDYAQAQYAEFSNDPRISAAMEEWESDEARLRERVQNFLADLSGA